jgi:hypothetical protein
MDASGRHGPTQSRFLEIPGFLFAVGVGIDTFGTLTLIIQFQFQVQVELHIKMREFGRVQNEPLQAKALRIYLQKSYYYYSHTSGKM